MMNDDSIFDSIQIDSTENGQNLFSYFRILACAYVSPRLLQQLTQINWGTRSVVVEERHKTKHETDLLENE